MAAEAEFESSGEFEWDVSEVTDDYDCSTLFCRVLTNSCCVYCYNIRIVISMKCWRKKFRRHCRGTSLPCTLLSRT